MSLEPNAKRIAAAFRRMKRAQWRKSPIEGIKYSEFMVLVHLNREVKEKPEGLNISDLSKLLQVAKPTVTQLVNSLDDHGYIERHHDQRDRRVVRIKLSSYGKGEMKKAYEEYIAFYNGMIETLGEEKSQQLADLLDEVHIYYEATVKQEDR